MPVINGHYSLLLHSLILLILRKFVDICLEVVQTRFFCKTIIWKLVQFGFYLEAMQIYLIFFSTRLLPASII